jgi:hypothetical protein
MTAHASPELPDAPCSVAQCLETASSLGPATVTVDPQTGAPPDFEIVTFGLRLCVNHAHLLRRGYALLDFHSGI